MKENNFNVIAPIYDQLAKIIFGSAIKKSQTYFLSHVPNHSKILIIGGGTGWILNELFSQCKPSSVMYVEASSKMLTLSKKNCPTEALTKTNFILGTEKDIPKESKYDVIITNFFLDVFTPSQLAKVVSIIAKHLKKNSFWVVTDFYPTDKWWQSTLIKLMYLFFRVTTQLRSTHLPPYKKYLNAHNLQIAKQQFFYHGMIQSAIYRNTKYDKVSNNNF